MIRLPKAETSSIRSPMDSYFREINNTPLLSAAEEKELAHRIAQGDSEARDRMVRANLRLVVNAARSYQGKGLDLPDLIAEGNLGLLRAVEGFDPTMNTRFSTYAIFWIRQSIKRALMNTGKTIRIPAYMVDLMVKWRRAASKLQDEWGRPPTPEEIGRVLKLSKKKLAVIKKAIRVSHANPQPDQEAHNGLLEGSLVDLQARSPDAEMVKTDDVQLLLELLSKMDPREALVLRLRFGLDGQEPKTFQEIGNCLGLTRERVRQIETLALRKLNGQLQEEEPDPAGPFQAGLHTHLQAQTRRLT